MNTTLTIAGLVQILVALVLGVLFLYLVFRVLQRLVKGMDWLAGLRENNIAMSIMNGTVILSVVLNIKQVLEPLPMIIVRLLHNPAAGFIDYLQTAGVLLLQILLSGAVALFGIQFGLRFFVRLTKDIEEFEEVKKNNIAVSILLAVVLFSIALLLSSGVQTLLDALIPFPEIALDAIG